MASNFAKELIVGRHVAIRLDTPNKNLWNISGTIVEVDQSYVTLEESMVKSGTIHKVERKLIIGVRYNRT